MGLWLAHMDHVMPPDLCCENFNDHLVRILEAPVRRLNEDFNLGILAQNGILIDILLST